MQATRHRASDGDLLRAARSDRSAFAELYARHEPIVAAFLQRRTRDAHLTADLVAETFVIALSKPHRFHGEDSAAGWLLRIASNLHLHFIRRGAAEQRACNRLGVEVSFLTDTSIQQIEALLEPGNERLALAVGELSDVQREAVLAVIVEERSYEELASVLGVHEATIRQRVSRGLGRLRTSMEGAQS